MALRFHSEASVHVAISTLPLQWLITATVPHPGCFAQPEPRIMGPEPEISACGLDGKGAWDARDSGRWQQLHLVKSTFVKLPRTAFFVLFSN